MDCVILNNNVDIPLTKPHRNMLFVLLLFCQTQLIRSYSVPARRVIPDTRPCAHQYRCWDEKCEMVVAGLSSYEGKFVPRHDTRLIPMRQLGTSSPYLDRAGTPWQDQNGAMHPEKAEQSHYGGSAQPNCEVATSGHSALTRGSTQPNSLMRHLPVCHQHVPAMVISGSFLLYPPNSRRT